MEAQVERTESVTSAAIKGQEDIKSILITTFEQALDLRNKLIGNVPTGGETAKNPEAPSGFFSQLNETQIDLRNLSLEIRDIVNGLNSLL